MKLHTAHPGTALLRLGHLLTENQRHRLETMSCNEWIARMNQQREKFGELNVSGN